MLRAEARVVVLLAYVLLTFAYAWPPDYRNTAPAFVAASWVAFLVRVLQFHLGLLLAVIAVGAALGRGRRLFLLAVPPVLFTLVPAYWRSMASPTPPPPAAGVPGLRVMSVNLLMVNDRYGPMLAEVRAARPDVLLLQEYTDGWDRALRPGLAADLPYVRSDARDDSFGVAVYSRTPFVDDGGPTLLRLGTDTAPQPRAVVRFGGRDVALYNVHLLPPRTLAYTQEGRLQFADLLDRLAAERLPVVVAGDFNLTETTPQHAALGRAGLADAWDLAGHGRGATWPVNSIFRYLPGLRFDHLYLGRQLTCTSVETGTGPGSDHRPIVADVAWRGS